MSIDLSSAPEAEFRSRIAAFEVWVPVPGYEGAYEVSDEGRVRSLPRARTRGGLLRPASRTNGYLFVTLRRDGVKKNESIHRLVAGAFLGSCPEGHQVRHLDGNKVNNSVENLAYGTQSDNELDKLRTGTNAQANKTHCPQGHAYTDENLYLYRGRYRRCRQCRTEDDNRKVGCPDCSQPIRRANLSRHRRLSCRAALASPAPAPHAESCCCRTSTCKYGGAAQ